MELSDKIGELILGGDFKTVFELTRILWDLQTSDEQRFDMTVHRNDVGLNSADAPFVGRFLGDLVKPSNNIPDMKSVLELRIRLYKYRGQLCGFTKRAWVEARHEELLQASQG